MTPLVSSALVLQTRWRWAVLGALLATIPAFYIEILEASPHWVGRTVYGLAACTLALGQWQLARLHADAWGYLRRQLQDGVLIAGLLLSALLPAASEFGWPLALRFTVAGLSLIRMVGLLRPWITRGSLRHVLALCVVIMGACGIGFWLLEPNAKTLADGLWLAFTTAATVGYGDIVPTTTAAKIFSVFVVLLGYAALSLVTAAIAAMWVETTERQVERDILNELHREVKALRAEIEHLRKASKR